MIKALGFRIVVRPDKVETTTESGLVLALDEQLEKTGVQRGVVVSVGPSAWKAYREMDEKGNEHNGKPWANPGDYILFARHAGRYYFDPFEPEGENEYMVMNDEDVIGIITEGDNPKFDNPAQQKVKKHVY
jgi:co-chaperonin GroES (HSP10)